MEITTTTQTIYLIELTGEEAGEILSIMDHTKTIGLGATAIDDFYQLLYSQLKANPDVR